MSKNTLTVSGERFSLGASSQRNQDDHVARYVFAADYVADKKVLDIACGTGYGAKVLKDAGAREVVGVDIDADTIKHATEHFSAEGVSFVCESASEVVLEPTSFDTIISFETIEHLNDDIRKKYLANLHACLKSDGVLLLSTPNKLITSPWSAEPLNQYHELEFYRDGLEQELAAAGFVVASWFGQRFVRKILTKRISYLVVRAIEKLLRKDFGLYTLADSSDVKLVKAGFEPRYFVVLAKKV